MLAQRRQAKTLKEFGNKSFEKLLKTKTLRNIILERLSRRRPGPLGTKWQVDGKV